jgi:hypothetical protein
MTMLSSLLSFERLSKNPVDKNKNLSLVLLMMFIGAEMQLLKCFISVFFLVVSFLAVGTLALKNMWERNQRSLSNFHADDR